MKKIILAVTVITLISSCSLFRKSEKYGCPTSGSAQGAEKLASGDPKALKAASKSKYKGGKKF
ncbi:hypothetical protein ACFOWM_06015 [Ferruginibacter yonginensis]|uniref:Lipoprotein n=1 Tax=Ferruginibacter yonginensis TaxID=1310416 RepID=A0ABV8QRH9_9BACT